MLWILRGSVDAEPFWTILRMIIVGDSINFKRPIKSSDTDNWIFLAKKKKSKTRKIIVLYKLTGYWLTSGSSSDYSQLFGSLHQYTLISLNTRCTRYSVVCRLMMLNMSFYIASLYKRFRDITSWCNNTKSTMLYI